MGEGVVALHLLGVVVEAVQCRFQAVAATQRLVDHWAIGVGADGAQAADTVGKDEGD
ncbi:MAG: hypothetical protein ACK418_23110 [Pseudomonas sp.]|uniref:hypothetical protein n=1 Tax=Pseudomonas sp. TaxID=306 RepID=UPI00391D71CF